MGCDQWSERLDAYFDGEVPSEEARTLSQHLRECAACAAAGLSRVQQKLAVRTAGHRFVPDPAFRSRIQSMIAPRRQSFWNRRWVPLLGTAFAVLMVGTFFFVENQKLGQQQPLGELADLHVATLASSNPVDVVSTDRHTVKPWFEGKVPFTFNLPELQNSPFTLVGGRVAYLNRSPGAELIFRIRQHQLSLFIFQEQALENIRGESESLTLFSFNVVSWTRNGLRYFLIGDVSPEDMNRLSELLKAAS
jgi:anti-sigma factor RsiW